MTMTYYGDLCSHANRIVQGRRVFCEDCEQPIGVVTDVKHPRPKQTNREWADGELADTLAGPGDAVSDPEIRSARNEAARRLRGREEREGGGGSDIKRVLHALDNLLVEVSHCPRCSNTEDYEWAWEVLRDENRRLCETLNVRGESDD